MGWSSGTFTQTDGTNSGDGICAAQAADMDPKIRAAEMDALFEDHADGINACINKDGSNAFTGDADLGGNQVTNMAEGGETGDAGRWDEDVASLSLDGTVLEVNMNDGGQVTVDLASIGSAGEVTISDDQTITGSKTLTGTTTATTLKTNGPIRHLMQAQGSSSSITCDTDSYSRFHITNNTTMTVELDLTDAADANLGNTWCSNGWIMFRNNASAGAVTITATNADNLEVIGSNPTTNGETYTLAYTIARLPTELRVQATWVTPS